MSNEQFLALVARMRIAQIRHFKDLGLNTLKIAKALEREVDKELNARLSSQGHLFDVQQV